jgi:hypothetical protein
MKQPTNEQIVTEHIKCWMVHRKWDSYGDLVHAYTRAQAIYYSECYTENCRGWRYIRAVRVPELDGKLLTDENVQDAGYNEELVLTMTFQKTTPQQGEA